MIAIGRFLLGLYFLVPGVMKFTAWDMHIGLMVSRGIPMPELGLAVAGVASIIGALLLWSNRLVKCVAIGFVVYILIVNVTLHAFWAVEPDMVARETQNFIKNLGILAGLLVLAGSAVNRPVWPFRLNRSDSAYSE